MFRFSAKVLPIRVVAKETKLKANNPAIVSGWGKLKVNNLYAKTIN